MRRPEQANQNLHNLSIDSSVLILCLSEDAKFREECQRRGRDVVVMPSSGRKALATMLGNQPSTWVLHQDQITELKQVIEGLIVESYQVLEGHRTPRPDKTYLDQAGIENADELLTYLKTLETEMITRSEREDIIFGGPGSDDGLAAVELAKELQSQVWRECHSKELCDTVIYAFSLVNCNPYLLTQSNTLVHFDSHIETIKGIVEDHIGKVRQHKTSGYEDLAPADALLYRKFFYPSRTREKTPVIGALNVVSMSLLRPLLRVLDPRKPDKSIKAVLAQQFHEQGIG